MKFTQTKTYLNLAKSFAGESQENVRYRFIEYGARQQGFACLAEMLDTIAFDEFNHARMFYTELQKNCKEEIKNIDIATGYPFKEKWDLCENLRHASEDENMQATDIYPQYAKIAKQEGFDDIALLFERVASVELCHSKLLAELYNQMKNKTLYKKDHKVKWKCASCGYESTAKEAWEECPLCLAKQGFVMLKVDNT